MLGSVNLSILYFANELMKRKLLMRMRKNQPMKIWEQRAADNWIRNIHFTTAPKHLQEIFWLVRW